MSRSLAASLANLQTVCASITTITLASGASVPNPFHFLAYPNIPGGTIDPVAWGITFPLGLLTSFRYGQEWRESGTIGSPVGADNQYLLRLLIAQTTGIAGRNAAFAEEEGFYSALKDVITPQDGNQCFPGVIWGRTIREHADYLTFGGVQYAGSYVIITLNERY
jgi:hypothetical protein